MSDVPVSLLWQVAYPRGKRLPKKVLISNKPPTPDPPAMRVISPIAGSIGFGKVGSTNKPFYTGNLEVTQYRYFKGSPEVTSQKAECRFCGKALYGPSMRALHTRETGCGHKIDAVSALLKQKNYCVACGRNTQLERWGLPLCSSACHLIFMYQTPTSYLEAIARLRTLPAGTKIGHVIYQG